MPLKDTACTGTSRGHDAFPVGGLSLLLNGTSGTSCSSLLSLSPVTITAQ